MSHAGMLVREGHITLVVTGVCSALSVFCAKPNAYTTFTCTHGLKDSPFTGSRPWQDVMLSLVHQLMSRPKAEPYSRPVDPEFWNIPDYFRIIKAPMDLGTVQARLVASQKDLCRPSGAVSQHQEGMPQLATGTSKEQPGSASEQECGEGVTTVVGGAVVQGQSYVHYSQVLQQVLLVFDNAK